MIFLTRCVQFNKNPSVVNQCEYCFFDRSMATRAYSLPSNTTPKICRVRSLPFFSRRFTWVIFRLILSKRKLEILNDGYGIVLTFFCLNFAVSVFHFELSPNAAKWNTKNRATISDNYPLFLFLFEYISGKIFVFPNIKGICNWIVEFLNTDIIYLTLDTVSYTHLTLPTICSV